MDKVKEYRRRAEECRNLSKVGSPEIRAQYQDLAEMWDRMADERLHFFVPPGQIGSNGHDQEQPDN